MVDPQLPPTRPASAWEQLQRWPARRWSAAAIAAAGVALLIGIPTDDIPTPVFGRPVPVTWWSYPTLAVTAVLGGLLAATYVRGSSSPAPPADEIDAPTRNGGIAGLLSFFAVGCPVCNQAVVALVGTSGALSWWAPVQPLVGLAAIALLVHALRRRLDTYRLAACPIPA